MEVCCGALHTAVLSSLGELATFGWGSTGALGHGTFGYELEARPIDALAAQRIDAICVGARHTVALELQTGGSSSLVRDLGELLSSAMESDLVLEAGRGK